MYKMRCDLFLSLRDIAVLALAYFIKPRITHYCWRG